MVIRTFLVVGGIVVLAVAVMLLVYVGAGFPSGELGGGMP